MRIAIVVHGGAGSWETPGERHSEASQACFYAASEGKNVLKTHGSALDAIEVAVRILEDSPVLDAGRGSFLTSDGTVELDAMIMDGRTMELGAVAAVKGIAHPVSLARSVMTESMHSFLVANGAETFADHIGFPRCQMEDLITEEQRSYYDENIGLYLEGKLAVTEQSSPILTGTVGAIALDEYGNLAAATSTGGTRFKFPGRVGDSPLVGAGTYADNLTGAVSATGHGESLMRILISKRVCDYIETGMSPQQACNAAIRLLEHRVNGKGGVIALNNRAEVGLAFNTTAMPFAYVTNDDEVFVGSHLNTGK